MLSSSTAFSPDSSSRFLIILCISGASVVFLYCFFTLDSSSRLLTILCISGASVVSLYCFLTLDSSSDVAIVFLLQLSHG